MAVGRQLGLELDWGDERLGWIKMRAMRDGKKEKEERNEQQHPARGEVRSRGYEGKTKGCRAWACVVGAWLAGLGLAWTDWRIRCDKGRFLGLSQKKSQSQSWTHDDRGRGKTLSEYKTGRAQKGNKS